MLIQKRYKFYAAHRNELLAGTKCARLHGHRYGLAVNLSSAREGAITILFDDIDKVIEPIVGKLDHRTLVHNGDTKLVEAMQVLDQLDNCVLLPFPTSVENMGFFLFTWLNQTHLGEFLESIELTETDSSTITYDREAMIDDCGDHVYDENGEFYRLCQNFIVEHFCPGTGEDGDDEGPTCKLKLPSRKPNLFKESAIDSMKKSNKKKSKKSKSKK